MNKITKLPGKSFSHHVHPVDAVKSIQLTVNRIEQFRQRQDVFLCATFLFSVSRWCFASHEANHRDTEGSEEAQSFSDWRSTF